jgi:hypothetical protein
MMKRLVPVLALLLGGCLADEVPGGPNPPVQPPVPPTNPDPVDVTVNPGGDGQLLPPQALPEDPFRQRRRMDLDQLDSSIRRVTGGIGWTERRGNTEVNLFAELGSTLGKPDYIQITDENLEPSAMFQKFLDDAARAVCDRLMIEESRRTAEQRTFFIHAEPNTSFAEHPDAVEANLIELLLRFHGRELAPGAAELGPWKWLFESAEHVTDDQPMVWRTLCVGLFEHPDFYTY